MTRAHQKKGTDLLFLNCSNYPKFPVFPYAFVQVSALARRQNLKVKRFDLIGIEQSHWEPLLREWIEFRPRMIGIHLRQLDSMDFKEYTTEPYFVPVAATAHLISILRSLTDLPIVIGGIGYTVMAPELTEYLKPDFGVRGCADDFFANFEDICSKRRLSAIPNLVYFENRQYQYNERAFHSPFTEREYDDETAGELWDFFNKHAAPWVDSPFAAIEIQRGCPYRCYFCVEPEAKGRGLRKRSLDVVMDEVGFLYHKHAIRNFWFVASEMNSAGPDLPLSLAKRISAFNSAVGDEKITWTGYLLPTFNKLEDMRFLRKSGYIPAWNEAQALSETNLKDARVPYKLHHLVSSLKTIHQLREEEAATGQSFPVDMKRVTLFLGNAFATFESVRATIEKFDSFGLNRKYEQAYLIVATRVHGGKLAEDPANVTLLDGHYPGSPPSGSLLFPTFHFPTKLLAHFRDREEYLEFFEYVGDTFLSRGHLAKKRWDQFVLSSTTFCAFSKMVFDAQNPGGFNEDKEVFEKKLADLFQGELERNDSVNSRFKFYADWVVEKNLPKLNAILDRFGIQFDPSGNDGLSESQVAKIFNQAYESVEELIGDVVRVSGVSPSSVDVFCFRWYLYWNNIRINPLIKKLMTVPGSETGLSLPACVDTPGPTGLLS